VDDASFGSNSGFALGALFSPDVDPFELERVEVLRGPQGTLYGASTLGGLVKYVTKAPDLQNMETHARLDFGRADGSHAESYSMRAGVNLPLAEDKAALRVSGYYSNLDGDVSDVRTGRTGLNGSSKQGGRIKLRVKPVDALTIDLVAFADESDAPHLGTIDGNAQTLQPTYDEYSGYDAVDGFSRSKYTVVEGTVNYDFANGLALTSTSSYSDFKVNLLADDTAIFKPALGALGSLLQFAGPVSPKTEKFTQELRLTSPANGHFEWLTGVFYDREDSDYHSAVTSTYLFGATPPPSLAPTVALLANYLITDNATRYTEYAAFANATYYLTPTFDVSAGVRLSRNEQERTVTASGFLTVIGSVATFGAADSEDSVWTEALGWRWQLSGDSMVYGRYATGYRPGGPNTSSTAFEPDETKNYELGFKTAGLAGRLRADVAVFYIDWSNIQLNYFDGVRTVIGNAGDARSQGVELQASFAPVQAFTVSANAAYTDAQMTSLKPGAQGGAAVGDTLPLTSEWAAGLLADYSFPVAGSAEWNVGAGLRYRSSFVTTFPGDTGTRFYTLPSTLFFDLRTGVSLHDRVALNLQVLNVTNERKLASAAQFLAVSQAAADAAGQPVALSYTPSRTYSLSLTTQF
jgi:outer membrane receptor protein involved in Fe transport